MRIVEMILNEESETQGVYAVSVVESPAIEENWVALNKHFIELKSVDEEKKILMGAALIPNKQILRYDKEIGEYYIYFSKDTIKKTSELFLKRNNQNNATYEHEIKVGGLHVVESWIVENSKIDKSANYGFDLPEGTWVITMKVENEDIWNKVKAGDIKGFSIEGLFSSNDENLSKQKDEETILEQIIDLLKNA